MTNIMGKSPAKVFEIEDGDLQALIGRGDVKYHLGFSRSRQRRGAPHSAQPVLQPVA